MFPRSNTNQIVLNCVVWTRSYSTILVNGQYFIFKRLENLTLTLNLLTLQEILLSDNQRQIRFAIAFSTRTNRINNCTLNNRCKEFQLSFGTIMMNVNKERTVQDHMDRFEYHQPTLENSHSI